MALFFPEWIPWWLQLIMVGIVVIFGICFLLMPFSVFGLKSRLTYLDHQMEDIQAQLRVLLKRIPDARERLEFKLQPLSTAEKEVTREEVVSREKKPSNSSEYYSAVATTKSRPVCFDPPSQSEVVPPLNPSSKTAIYDNDSQFSEENRLRNRVSSPIKEIRMPEPERREEQLYNPPSQPVREERREGSQPRRRAEPILRWPPK